MALNCNQLVAAAVFNCRLIILILIFTTINTTTSLEGVQNTLGQEITYPNSPIFYEEGDICTTNSGKSGKCVELSKCQNIGELMLVNESPVSCGFGVYEEVICCPNQRGTAEVTVPPRQTSTPVINMFSTTSLPIINSAVSAESQKVDDVYYQNFIELINNALTPTPLQNTTFSKSGTIGEDENPFLPKRNKTEENKTRNPWLPPSMPTNIRNISRPETNTKPPSSNHKPIIYPTENSNESFGSTTKSPVSTRSKERPATIACAEIEKGLIPSLSTHILGGEAVDLGEYPHVAALGYADLGGDEYDFRCGGSLIASKFVLTAAHCVSRRDMSPVMVRLGVVKMDDPSELENAVDRTIKKIHIHPEYTTSRTYNDIAILELERDVEYSDRVYPACLSTETLNPTEKSITTVTGWGVTNVTTRTVSKRLLKATLSVVSLDACKKEYTTNRQLPQGIIETQMCAVDPKGIRDACQGDSGGPLNLVVDESLKQYKILGITSTGYGCGSLIPGIYTRVSAYLDYIENVVWPTSSSD